MRFIAMNIDHVESIMTGLGFSLYEARAYAALVGENPLTGYELSKRSGIPRSKIYECIERLNRKRLVIPVSDNPVRYVPVPPDELVRRLSSEFESSVQMLGTLLKEGIESDTVEYIFNISGYKDIIDRAGDMIRSAHSTLELSLWKQEIRELEIDLRQALERGVTVRLISFNGDELKWAAEVYRHRPLRESEFSGRWITIVKDKREVLTGQCSGEGGIVVAWTRNKCLVFVSLKYIEHEIIKIKEYT